MSSQGPDKGGGPPGERLEKMLALDLGGCLRGQGRAMGHVHFLREIRGCETGRGQESAHRRTFGHASTAELR